MTAKAALETAREWLDDGKITVSPAEAGAVLGADGPSIASAAKIGTLGIPYFMSGRNVRISVPGIVRFLQGGEDPYRENGRKE